MTGYLLSFFLRSIGFAIPSHLRINRAAHLLSTVLHEAEAIAALTKMKAWSELHAANQSYFGLHGIEYPVSFGHRPIWGEMIGGAAQGRVPLHDRHSGNA
jgi:hypothetical protein